MIVIVSAEGLPFVWVGRTDDVEARLASLSAASPVNLYELKRIEGGPLEALALRSRLRAHHHHAGWYVASAGLLAELTALERVDVAPLACPQCGKPKRETRAEYVGKLCIECSQRLRWQRLSSEQKESGVAAMLAPEPRAKAQAERAARAAERKARSDESRAAKAICIDCGVPLPIQPGRVAGDRRCRACGMRAAWARPEYRNSRAVGQAAFLAERRK